MEIKIRVWLPKLNKMVYLHEPENDWDVDGFPIVLSFKKGKSFILDFEAGHNEDYEGAIIMLYTGLEDEGGKEIYEGDILKITDYPYLPQSEHKDYSSPFYKNEKVIYEAPNFNLGGWLNFDFDCKYEIIGNIYKNDGLIEK